MRKAQIEIAGLVIIVLLILVGIFLMVFLGGIKSDSKDTGYNQKLVESFVSTLPEVKVACGTQNIAYKEFIRATALHSSWDCLASTDAKTVITDETQKILDNSLKQWGYDYIFEIRDALPPAPAMVALHNPKDTIKPVAGVDTTVVNACKTKKRKVMANHPIPIATGGTEPVMIVLTLCY
jgi:hypothetical protein